MCQANDAFTVRWPGAAARLVPRPHYNWPVSAYSGYSRGLFGGSSYASQTSVVGRTPKEVPCARVVVAKQKK